MESYIAAAAKEAGHEGFGAIGCDLNQKGRWVAYMRQSLEEQTQNNRLPDYLRTCAHQAKELGVMVPQEYVMYDAVTGEHLERPAMMRLRRLIAERKIDGVIFPALDRLSREPLHQQIFEMEAAHYGVRLHYADAPNGTDLGSQFTRSILSFAAKLVKEANHKNARGGQIGRVVKGMVPAHKAAYGYRYMADRDIGPNGRVLIKNAWWDVDELGPDGEPLERSPAWVVIRMFNWLSEEGRTFYWIANELNQMGIKAPAGGKWYPSRVSQVAHNRCYTGHHAYNVHARVSNPDRPLGDITAQIKRTLLQVKPESEWVRYEVPALVSPEVWQKAMDAVTTRGRGRGKRGKTIQALLRNRIMCPRCGNSMIVRRNGRHQGVYYHCSKYFRPWADGQCSYRRFLSGTLDDLIWDDLSVLLRDDTWVEQQMASQQVQDESSGKLIRLQQYKISQATARIAKVREGFEGGLYDLREAKARITGHQAAMAAAEEEVRRLQVEAASPLPGAGDLESLRVLLRGLRDQKLNGATFEERLDLICKLDVKVYPSEDVQSMRVTCRLGLPTFPSDKPPYSLAAAEPHYTGESEAADGSGIVLFAPPLI
jgi:DNA invertase Pin-like site-specific DNA recombinase